MATDALQYVDKIGVRINIMEFTGGDQALNDPYMLGAQFCPTEHPVLFLCVRLHKKNYVHYCIM